MQFSPIRLTPFEWMMLEDVGQLTPMTYIIRLRLSGDFDPDAFVDAVHQTVHHHPLLRANVQGSHGKDLKWVPAANPMPYLDIADSATACHFPGTERIDLRKETGLRIWARQESQVTELRFQFHHACCDGTGAYRVIEDVLCSYHSIRTGISSGDVLRPVDLTTLTRRDRFFVGVFPCRSKAWRDLIVHPLRVARCVVERPDPIFRSEGLESTQESDSLLLNLPSHRFTKSESGSLRRAATTAGATTNELLLRDLLLTLDQWNKGHESGERKGRLRILVPISLRTKYEDKMPAANVLSLVSVTGRQRSLADPERLLAEIVREMVFIRQWRVDVFLHEEGSLVRAIPGVAHFLRQMSGGCFLSSALTNMGKLFARAQLPRKSGKLQAGGLTLESVAGAPPVSSFNATFGCHWYAGELIMTVNYDRHRFGKTQAEQLMSAYVRHVIATANS